MIKSAVINFSGSNCTDETVLSLMSRGYEVKIINGNETMLNYDLIVLPGGFSYGDYVAAGRIAKFTPVMEALKKRIGKTFILGICNGFQILLEAGFLKGALIQNENQKFISKDVELIYKNTTFTLPIAHKEGRYHINEIEEDYEYIKYKNNPNGSKYDIAGIFDRKNKIFALMPHPERNMITPFKRKDGNIIFDLIEKEINGTV